MNKKLDEKLSEQETAERERRVLDHFLTSKPEPHRPLGKKSKMRPRKKKQALK